MFFLFFCLKNNLIQFTFLCASVASLSAICFLTDSSALALSASSSFASRICFFSELAFKLLHFYFFVDCFKFAAVLYGFALLLVFLYEFSRFFYRIFFCSINSVMPLISSSTRVLRLLRPVSSSSRSLTSIGSSPFKILISSSLESIFCSLTSEDNFSSTRIIFY